MAAESTHITTFQFHGSRTVETSAICTLTTFMILLVTLSIYDLYDHQNFYIDSTLVLANIALLFLVSMVGTIEKHKEDSHLITVLFTCGVIIFSAILFLFVLDDFKEPQERLLWIFIALSVNNITFWGHLKAICYFNRCRTVKTVIP